MGVVVANWKVRVCRVFGAVEKALLTASVIPSHLDHGQRIDHEALMRDYNKGC